MQVIRTIHALREAVAALKRSLEAAGRSSVVGFVPTMGYLHEGHASLMQRARHECGIVVLSVFVNPLQFGPNEDFERYPRDEERDTKLAEANGVDIVFIPDVKEMYPKPVKTTVSVGDITSQLCGASRPGHFDGVCTVVSKLFHIVEPDFAYFGMKDAQQVAVIEQMTADLSMRVTIVRCPILREQSGLAMSSRNVYLSPEEREQALVLSHTLRAMDDYVREEKGDAQAVRRRMIESIERQPLAEIDYVELVSYPALEPVTRVPQADGTPVLAALAVKFGRTRLIDNRLFE